MRNKPQTSSPASSAVLPASPPLLGTRFSKVSTAAKDLCAGGYTLCDFGDHSAPVLIGAYIGDLDSSGAWSYGDYLEFTFDRCGDFTRLLHYATTALLNYVQLTFDLCVDYSKFRSLHCKTTALLD